MGRYTTVTRRTHVRADARVVLDRVASTDGFTSINPHRTADPQLEISPSGPAYGVGSGFAFRGKNGKGTQVISAITDREVTYDIDMGSMGRSQQRIIATPAATGGTDVEWTMTLDAGRNPVLRVFGLVADRVLGPTLDIGLQNLSTLPR